MEYTSSPEYFFDIISREGVKKHIDAIAKKLAFIEANNLAKTQFPKIEEAKAKFAEVTTFYALYKTRRKAEIIEKMLFFYQEELFYFDVFAFLKELRKKQHEDFVKKVTENDYHVCTDAKFVLVSPQEEGEEDMNFVFENLGDFSEKITTTNKGYYLNGFFNPFGSKSHYKVKEDEKGKYILRWSDHWSSYKKNIPENWIPQMQAIPELWAFLKEKIKFYINDKYLIISGCGNIKTCYWDLMVPFEFDDITDNYYSSNRKYFLGKCYLSDFVRNDNLTNHY